jgi:protein ImuA
VLRVNVLKRRGPPLAQPLHLALAPVLSAPEQARARATRELPRLGVVSDVVPAVAPDSVLA